MFSGFFFLVATTLTLTPSAPATNMSSRGSEIFAAATTYSPGSRASEHGQHMETSVVSSSGISTDTGTAIPYITPRRDETTLFEAETIMATSTPSSSSVSTASHPVTVIYSRLIVLSFSLFLIPLKIIRYLYFPLVGSFYNLKWT